MGLPASEVTLRLRLLPREETGGFPLDNGLGREMLALDTPVSSSTNILEIFENY